MMNHPLHRCYPTSVRIAGQPVSVLSDDDLLFHLRRLAGDDLHDLVRLRLSLCENVPDRASVVRALESLQRDVSDVSSSIDSLLSQFDA